MAPLLTEKDDVESGEGGIDPLGTEPMADRLASKLIPGVRERQRHPRFLTALAVSLSLCSEFEDEVLASDGVSEPWLVWEWYFVEGMVRTLGRTTDAILGLPGREKAASAISDGVPVSAKRYLKTPTVFGFHGIYRLLAEKLGVQQDGRLGERGYELLNVWSKEQGLEGFVGMGGGRGRRIRDQLREALSFGLKTGAVARGGGWSGWRFFAEHLAPYRFGRNESRLLTDALVDDPFRRAVWEFLVSVEGQRLWRRQISDKSFSERSFHKALRHGTTGDLLRLLRAIGDFERFGRLLQNAFDDCLYSMTCKRGKVLPLELGRLSSAKLASTRLPEMFNKVMDTLEPFGEALRFQQRFASLAEVGTATEWVERLMQHHRGVQQQKPPDGKNPWVERFDDGGIVIRPLYLRHDPAKSDDGYVHSFRTNSLWSFARDLGLVRG
ncbi:MAG TPA: hypothetical protein VG096_06600 [Bryobacteraceae bacterium]|nr:hypothetical protein [Bryobacteraceae bacterium]